MSAFSIRDIYSAGGICYTDHWLALPSAFRAGRIEFEPSRLVVLTSLAIDGCVFADEHGNCSDRRNCWVCVCWRMQLVLNMILDSNCTQI